MPIWMNAGDVEWTADACKEHPVLGPATAFLKALMDSTDEQSDGWCHWPAPAHSAAQLMQLIRDNTGGMKQPRSGITITLDDVKATLPPIRRMATLQEQKAKKHGNRYHFDVDATWQKVCGIETQAKLF